MMDMENFGESLAETATAFGHGQRMSDITLNGAHGKPMRRLLAEGESQIWTGGDLGRLLGDDSDGFNGLAEIGFGHGFSDGLTGQVALGRFGENVDFDTGGRQEGRMTMVIPELTATLAEGLNLTLTGLYGQGQLTNHRTYLNGADLVSSSGESAVRNVSGRIRLDWLDALSLGGTAITPFASYTVSRSTYAGYTETGGTFPVSWNDHTSTRQLIRAGFDGLHTVTDSLTLIAHTEGSYGRADDTDVTGRIIGLSTFSEPTSPSHRWGAQGGIGAEFDTGKGTASLMLNGAIGANNPVAWVAASHRVKF